MGEDKYHLNEIDVLEFVGINYGINEILNFIYTIDNYANELTKYFSLPNSKLASKMVTENYENLIKKYTTIEEAIKANENIVILNFPTASPLIKGLYPNQTEVRWYMREKYIGHGYLDEFDCNIINLSAKFQNPTSNEDINMMEYFQWGLLDTGSFGLGIDRWIQMLLNYSNIKMIANPLGLDYQKEKRLTL